MLDGADRDAVITIPRRRGLGGLMALETLTLIAAARRVNARSIFEFGTFLGATTYSLARNTQAEIVTLDLTAGEAQRIQQNPSEAEITALHVAAAMDYDGKPESSRITAIQGNSLTFDVDPYRRGFDFIFIDAGHELPNVIADTNNALAMLKPEGCIAWHDYGNPDYPELKDFLDHLPFDILHVEDTW